MPFFADIERITLESASALLALAVGLKCYVRPLPLTYPVRQRVSNSGRSRPRQRRFPENRRIDDQPGHHPALRSPATLGESSWRR